MQGREDPTVASDLGTGCQRIVVAEIKSAEIESARLPKKELVGRISR
jgi:hypothetical protein